MEWQRAVPDVPKVHEGRGIRQRAIPLSSLQEPWFEVSRMHGKALKFESSDGLQLIPSCDARKIWGACTWKLKA